MPAESADQFRRRVLGGETLFGLFLDLVLAGVRGALRPSRL